ncbi:MAG: hypothetical protein IB618_02150 [Candidatus Pacearchaeota archaeon]|nr:MAG: hypothetical protein IB618_02150 [Candidatus Pacearchaeota archaeon]
MKSKLLLIFLVLVLLFNLSLASAAFAKMKVLPNGLPNGNLGLTFEKAGTWPAQIDVNFRFKASLKGCGFAYKDNYFYYTGDFDTNFPICIQAVEDASIDYGPRAANTLNNAFRPLFYEFRTIKFLTPKELQINDAGYIGGGKLIYPVTKKDKPGWIGRIIDRIDSKKIVISGAEINFEKDQNWILLNQGGSFIGLQHETSDDYLFLESSDLKLSYQRNITPEADKNKDFKAYLAFYPEDKEGNPLYFSIVSRAVAFETKERTLIKKKNRDYCIFEGKFLVDGSEKSYYDICPLRTGFNLENLGDALMAFLDIGTSIKSENSEVIQPKDTSTAKDLISVPAIFV